VSIHPDARITEELHFRYNHKMLSEAAFALFFIGKMDAIRPLYGRKARDLSLIEAGLMAKLIELAAPSKGIGVCQVGAIRNGHRLKDLFRLDDDHEFLHSMMGGPLSEDRSEPPGGKRLGKMSVEKELQDFLAGQLPEYMVPQSIIRLEELPLSPTGKVDRKQLMRLAEKARQTPRTYTAPRNETEQVIAHVLEELLGVGKLGIHDNFFDLGADSVTVARAHSRIQAKLGMDFPLISLFHYPNISLLAAHLSGQTDQDEALRKGSDRARLKREARGRLGAKRNRRGGNGQDDGK
jgi:hypothetical protein